MFRTTRFVKALSQHSTSSRHSSRVRYLATSTLKSQRVKINEEIHQTEWHFPHEEGYIVNSPYEPITFSNLSLDQFIWQNINKWQNHTAIVRYCY